MTVLHINASARGKESNSRIISQYLVDSLAEPVVTRDLGLNPLPPISGEDLIGVHGSFENDRPSLDAQLALSDGLIHELKAAKTLVIASPMYNFSVPANLKRWIDAIFRTGLTFKYTDQGPVGLLEVERAFIVTSSGGTPIGSEMDFASTYLESTFRFLGVKDVVQIEASGSKGSPELIIAEGKAQIDRALAVTAPVAVGGSGL